MKALDNLQPFANISEYSPQNKYSAASVGDYDCLRYKIVEVGFP